MSWAIRIIGRPGSGKPTSADVVAAGHGVALDDEETLHPGPRLETHAPDFQGPVDDMPLLDGRLHHGAATTVTHAERNVP